MANVRLRCSHATSYTGKHSNITPSVHMAMHKMRFLLTAVVDASLRFALET